MNDGHHMYVGMSKNKADGYSRINNDRGNLKVFVVKRELHLTNISEPLEFFEYEDAINFCENAVGYYNNWSHEIMKPPQV